MTSSDDGRPPEKKAGWPAWYGELSPEARAFLDEMPIVEDEEGDTIVFFPAGPRLRPWSEHRMALAPGATIATSADLQHACADTLTEALTFVARSAQRAGEADRPFESTFIIVEFKVDENASAYVQFLSDSKHRSVFWEVSSLDYQPGLASRLTPARRASLVARGFKKLGNPSNFRREVVIDDDASARRVAEEALDILFDELGYRGAEPLWIELVAEE